MVIKTTYINANDYQYQQHILCGFGRLFLHRSKFQSARLTDFVAVANFKGVMCGEWIIEKSD